MFKNSSKIKLLYMYKNDYYGIIIIEKNCTQFRSSIIGDRSWLSCLIAQVLDHIMVLHVHDTMQM